MSVNLTNSLLGLSFLTGDASLFGASSAPAFESAAARKAKKAFTTPDITPPWKEKVAAPPPSVRLTQILAAKTLLDKSTGKKPVPDDVQTSFVAFKALDKLKELASSAAKTDNTALRDKMNAAFQRGLAELESFLSDAPSDKVSLAFAQVRRKAETVKIKPPALSTNLGEGVSTARDAALKGLTGQEVFSIKIRRGTQSSQVSVDLSTGPQPPTLDSVANLVNAAIATVKMTDMNGNVALDGNGQPQPKWLVKFDVSKQSDKWGFKIDTPGGEEVSIDQVGAGDSLVIASGLSSAGKVEATKVMRLDDPATLATRMTIANLTAVDSEANEAAKIYAPPAKPIKGVTPAAPVDLAAGFHTNAVVTANDGSTYTIGTTKGEVAGQKLLGTQDLVLTKMNSDGDIMWQQTLGTTADASGAAISLAPNGDIVVAGTVTGSFDGANTDGDMLVARFNAAGTELDTTLIRSIGADVANAVAVGADGSIFVAGKVAGNGGDAYIARLDANGTLQERRRIDSGASDSVSALAVAADGSLLALTNESGEARVRKLDAANLNTDIASYGLGKVDARVLAIGDDGSIAVGGATSIAVTGNQNNAISGGRDGFVARIDAGLGAANVSYIGTGADDEVDSITFLNGDLYAGGRTKGALAGARIGEVDGFVARLDSATGAVANSQQVGLTFHTTGAMHLAAAKGANTVLGSLGLARGVISGRGPTELATQTSLRTGDNFQIAVGNGARRKITIEAGETMQTLAAKLRKMLGSNAIITTPSTSQGTSLAISPKSGVDLRFFAGSGGQDALAKLGIEPGRVAVDPILPKNAPKVRPGGRFGLELTTTLDLKTKDHAAISLKRIEAAVSMTQSAYRSLYWDATKARMADGGTSTAKDGHVSSYQAAQLGRYQAALKRLTG